MKKKIKINEKAVRAAITTLFKNGVVKSSGWQGDDFPKNKVSILLNVDARLVTTKKKENDGLKRLRKAGIL